MHWWGRRGECSMFVSWNVQLVGFCCSNVKSATAWQTEVSIFWSAKNYFAIRFTPFPPNSLLLLHCYDSTWKHLQTHWTDAVLVELQAQFHHGFSLDLQYSCSLFKFLDKVHTVLQNWLPGRKCIQETRWEHNIVKCFTALGEDTRASVECDLLHWSDMQVTSFTFLEPSWFTFPLQAISMKLEPALLLSGSLRQDLLKRQWLHVLCQQLLLLRRIPDPASCAFIRWCRIFQPFIGLKCTGFFCVLCVFFVVSGFF